MKGNLASVLNKWIEESKSQKKPEPKRLSKTQEILGRQTPITPSQNIIKNNEAGNEKNEIPESKTPDLLGELSLLPVEIFQENNEEQEVPDEFPEDPLDIATDFQQVEANPEIEDEVLERKIEIIGDDILQQEGIEEEFQVSNKKEPDKVVSEWAKEFPWHSEIMSANKLVFGHTTFRENQLEIINATRSGRDVIGLMPTGGGKSLTFQLTSITQTGVTFVIMPLLSLIMDQVKYLETIGINTVFFKRGMPTKEFYNKLLNLEEIKLLYSPSKSVIQIPPLSQTGSNDQEILHF